VHSAVFRHAIRSFMACCRRSVGFSSQHAVHRRLTELWPLDPKSLAFHARQYWELVHGSPLTPERYVTFNGSAIPLAVESYRDDVVAFW
jgi:hypothetical protein